MNENKTKSPLVVVATTIKGGTAALRAAVTVVVAVTTVVKARDAAGVPAAVPPFEHNSEIYWPTEGLHSGGIPATAC